MKTIWKTVFVLLAVTFMTLVSAEEFKVRKDYEVLAFPQPVETGSKIEVREFFWYGCTHCYTVEPVLSHWLRSLPKNAQFIRTPGTYKPWQFLGQVYYTMEALDLVDKLHKPMFNAIQKDNRTMNSVDDVIKFVETYGVSREQFTKTYNSFGVRLKMSRAIQMNAEYNIRSVPSFVVDGKYRTGPSMAKGDERLMKVLEFLIKKAARERGK